MGLTSSLPGKLSEEQLEEYLQLTYLSRNDILILLKKIMTINPCHENLNPNYRFQFEAIVELLPQLKYNPFRDRLLRVFSSEQDDLLSFEDVLDLCSVMSENCPYEVKARWAFHIYDFNEDGSIDGEDIEIIIGRLTNGKINNDVDKKHIVQVLLEAINLQKNGSINQLEFEHAIGKMPDFVSTFSFKI
ncbi:hypothetical protein RI129_002474 [Pyrocoelia pectoralis]|uniref:EF-hand domain-containing protein n=1 Tax=Pyrocoelia pectoralis TaxID=417401 RepID=A0AAN7ZLE6_9COLE